MPKWTVPPKGGHMDKRTGVYLQNVIGHEVDERLKMNDILVVPLGANRPSQLYGQLGARPIEVKAYIEGVVGRSRVARAKKAYEDVEQLLDSLGTSCRTFTEPSRRVSCRRLR